MANDLIILWNYLAAKLELCVVMDISETKARGSVWVSSSHINSTYGLQHIGMTIVKNLYKTHNWLNMLYSQA